MRSLRFFYAPFQLFKNAGESKGRAAQCGQHGEKRCAVCILMAKPGQSMDIGHCLPGMLQTVEKPSENVRGSKSS